MRPNSSQQSFNNAVNKNIFKAIIQNISVKSQEHKEYLKKILQEYEVSYKKALGRIIEEDKKLSEIFKKQVSEYFSWQGAYYTVIKDQKYSSLPGTKELNVDDALLGMLNKVNIIDPHRSYFMEILALCRKKQWPKELGKQWGEVKNQKYKSKIQSAQKMGIQQQQFPSGEKSKQTPKMEALQKIIEKEQKNEPKETQQQKLPANTSQAPKPIPTFSQQKQRNLQIKRQSQKNAELIRIQRAQRIMKYLEYRHDFYIAPNNMTVIASEIVHYLDKFMNSKIKQVLHAAKLSHEGYNSPSIGNQFKYYGQKATDQQSANRQATIKIPKYGDSISFIKLQMPSKLQNYNQLRIEQQKHEQYYRNQVKSKVLEFDKKSDKFLQNYTFEDSRASNQTENKIDLGAHKTTRLRITSSSVQWMLARDPYFCDSWVMQRSLYQ